MSDDIEPEGGGEFSQVDAELEDIHENEVKYDSDGAARSNGIPPRPPSSNGSVADKPKQPQSAYNIFFKHERSRIVEGLTGEATPEEIIRSIEGILSTSRETRRHGKTHGRISFGDLVLLPSQARKIAAKWKSIGAEQNVFFACCAELDMIRYREEFEVWVKVWKEKNDNEAFGYTSEEMRNDKDIVLAASSGSGSKGKRRTWKKPKDKPKQPPSAYNIFFKHERSRIVEGLTGEANPEEIIRSIEGILSTSREPLSAYNIFFKHERSRIVEGLTGEANPEEIIRSIEGILSTSRETRRHRKTHGRISFGDLVLLPFQVRKIAKKWKSIGAEQKAVFEHCAELDMRRYREEVEVWVKVWKEKKKNEALGYASEEMRNDKDIVLAAVKKNARALEVASDELRNNSEFVLAAVSCRGRALQYASKELRNNRDFVLAALQKNGRALKYASEEMRDDRDFVLAALQKNGRALKYASEEMRNDRDIVLAAVKKNARAFEFSPEKMRNDREFVLATVNCRGRALQFASKELRNDRHIVSEALKEDGGALEFASKKLRNDRDIVLAAVKQRGWALEFASEEFRNDRDIVLAAVKSRGGTLKYASKELRNDRDIVLEALKQSVWAFEFASEELKNDRHIVLAAVCMDGNMLKYASVDLRGDIECVRAAVHKTPTSLKYALGGLNQNPECLRAAGIWDENHQRAGPRLVLSTRFSLDAKSTPIATRFMLLLKENAYIKSVFSGNLYFPNAFDKQTCDPNWTDFSWPCRGTFDTCRMHPAQKTGEPTNDSCWRYSFRYQLEEAKRTQGAMIQIVEPYELGDGQKIELEMAKDLGVKVFQVYTGIRITIFIDALVEEMKSWYKNGNRDTETTIVMFDGVSQYKNGT